MSSRILLCTTVAWPFAARLAGAFRALGTRVEALLPRHHPMRSSRHLNGEYIYSPLAPLESLRRAIAAAAPDLLVACDDRAMAQLRQLHAEAEHPALADIIAHSFGDLSVYSRLVSRHGFINEARMIAVPAPPTMAVRDEPELEASLAILGFPAVLKADESWGGDGVMVVHDYAQAREALRRLRARGNPLRDVVRAMKRRDAHFLPSARGRKIPDISIQKYVAGRPATSSFACWQGEVVGISHFDVIETNGAAGPACVVRRVNCRWMDDAARRIASHYDLSGLHGLDFMRDADGIPQLIEINPRATPTSHMALGLDHDLVAGLLTAALGHPLTPRPPMTEKNLIALFPQEWQRDPHSPYLATAYHDAPWDDPGLLRASLSAQQDLPMRTRRHASP